MYVYNNTFVNGGYDIYNYHMNGGPLITESYKNNVFVGNAALNTYFVVTNGSATITNTDSNLYWNARSDGWNGATSLANWRTTCRCDANATLANPLLDGSYLLQSGSPASTLGANLANVGIAPLDSDKIGTARPPNGNWSAGAFQYGGSIPPPAPPSGLVAVTQ
jgi:hypothetical protein